MADKDPLTEKSLDIEVLTGLVESKDKWAAKIFAAAKYYISLGWPVIPISYGGKGIPGREALRKRGLKKQLTYEDSSTSPERIKHWFHPQEGIWRGMNIGLACGSVISVADLDVKDDKNGIKEYESHFGFEHGRTPTATTPSGGVHIVFRHVTGFRTRTNVLAGVDTRGSKRDGGVGSHIVVYPSVVDVHTTGEIRKVSYAWDIGGSPQEPPEKLIQTVAKIIEFKPRDNNRPGRGNENVDDGDYFPDATLEDVSNALEKIDPSCDRDQWLYIGMSIHSEWDGTDGFDIWHEWSSKGSNYKNERDCWNVWQSFTNEEGGITIATMFKVARVNGYRKPGELSPELVESLRYNDKGGLKNTNHNLWVILQSPEFRDEFQGFLKFDIFKDHILAGSQEFVNEGYTHIARWVSTTFMFERGPDTVRQYSRMIAKDNSIDTLKEYVEDLVWDGKDRLPALAKILCATNDYQKSVISKWLIGGVARAMIPGCTSTHMLILHGAQGIGKSRFFEALSPHKDWFTDSPTFKFQRDTANRDEEIKLQGKWIVEVPELAGIWKSDYNDLKNFLTLQAPTVRKPYDPDPTDMPRRCVFGGSTNSDDVINDPTGSRRFAFLKVGTNKINVEWVNKNSDQIWAQAKSLFDAKQTWWFDDDEMELQTEENKVFRRSHPWTDPILDWAQDKSRFTSADIFKYVLHMELQKQNQRDLADCKGILETAGWRRSTMRSGDKTFKGWKNPIPTIDDQFKSTKWEAASQAAEDEY